MPGKLTEGKFIRLQDCEGMAISYGPTDLIIRPTNSLVMIEKVGLLANFVICRGLIYVSDMSGNSGILGVDNTAVVIDPLEDPINLEGTENGFRVMYPDRSAEYTHDGKGTNSCRQLQIGGIIIRASMNGK